MSFRDSRDERGASNSIAMVLLSPVLLLVIFAGVQLGLRYSAQQAAVAAARAAAEQARTMPPGDANSAATQVLASGNLHDPQVDVSRGATTVTVTVTGQAPSVLWGSSVLGTVTYPVERLS